MLRRSLYALLPAGRTWPRVRLQDLRHSTATPLLEHGVHPRIVSEILGHATVTIILDTHSHVTRRCGPRRLPPVPE
jgi:site-specific recombinase XerD